jgi:BASS family bile acid:Na+ symporter
MNTVWIVLPILLVLMFQLGLELDRKAFAGVVRHPRGVAAGALGQLVVLPLVAFGVALLFRLDALFFMGLMLVACSPGGSSSNVFSMLARGDVALSVTLTALSSLVTLVTIPLIMEAVARFVALRSDAAIELPVGRLLVQNIVLLLLPMACGALFRRRFPARAQRLHALLGRIAFPALMLLAALFFIQYADTILENLPTLGVASLQLILAAMAAGHLLARAFGLDRAGSRTVVIEVGMQNAAQAIAVASSPLIFNNETMAVPAIVYALVMNVVLLLYLKAVQRRDARRAVQ